MAFAGAVFTAQNNWRDATNKTKAELTKVNTNLNNLKAEFDKEKNDAAEKSARLVSENQKLAGQNTALNTQVTTLDFDNRQLRKDVDQQRDQSALTSSEAAERKKEADLQREKNSELFGSREDLVRRLNDTEDKRFALDVQLQQVSEKYDLLLGDFKTMKSFLASKELTTDPKQMIVQTAPPPPVDGIVTKVLKPDRGSLEYIEISIGSDDGLVVGHKMTVYSTGKNGKYIAVIRLTLVQADKSVGIVVQDSRMKNTTVSVGDSVTTRL